MTIEQLIGKLSKYPREAGVFIDGEPVTSVELDRDEDAVYLHIAPAPILLIAGSVEEILTFLEPPRDTLTDVSGILYS